MNEKIKELALKSGFDFDVHGSNDNNFYGWDGRWINEDINKFAKLIIQECVDAHYEDYQLDIISDVINKHFGFE